MKTTKKVEATETTLRCDNCGEKIASCDEEYMTHYLLEEGWQYIEKKDDEVLIVNQYYPEDATHHFCCWSCFETWKFNNGIDEEKVKDLDDEMFKDSKDE